VVGRDAQVVAHVKPVCGGPVRPDPGVEVHSLAALSRGLVGQPLHQLFSVTSATVRGQRREVIEVEVPALGQVCVADTEPGDGNCFGLGRVEDSYQSVADRPQSGVDEVGQCADGLPARTQFEERASGEFSLPLRNLTKLSHDSVTLRHRHQPSKTTLVTAPCARRRRGLARGVGPPSAGPGPPQHEIHET
jgi:hypothetical protein